MMIEQNEEKKNKIISGSITSVITILLLLLFWFYKFNVEIPLLAEEGGVSVSYGDPNAGGPEEVPIEAYEPPAKPLTNQNEAREETLDPDAVAVKKTPDVVKKQVTPKEPEEDDIIKKMRENAQKNKNKPSNAGSGTTTGSQGAKNGKPGGDPNGTGGDNTGTGNTVGNGLTKTTTHSFGNRKMYEPSNSENCGEKGTVIVDVVLKSDGSVIPTGINPSTKSSNICLQNLATKLAKKTRFAASEDDNREGTITFKFTF